MGKRGVALTEEQKANIRKGMIGHVGHPHTEETRKRISETKQRKAEERRISRGMPPKQITTKTIPKTYYSVDDNSEILTIAQFRELRKHK